MRLHADQPRVLLLAGQTESGKSTAGVSFEQWGAVRIKIRPLIESLHSGRSVEHEGFATRAGFNHEEFLDRLRSHLAAVEDRRLVVLESFTDVEHALFTRTALEGRLLWITAPLRLRLGRLSEMMPDTSAQQVRAIVAGKDVRKRVVEQAEAWASVADFHINNDQGLDVYLSRLRTVYDSLATTA